MNPFFFELIPPVPDPSKFEEILFVDRDGVVIVEKNYIKDPRELEFIPGSIDALRSALKANCFVAVVSNQAGLAKGILTETQFKGVNSRFIALLRQADALVHCAIYCPTHPDGVVPAFALDDGYRKPAPGMYELVKKRYRLPAKRPFMIGDKATDIEFGKNIAAVSILVQTGYGLSEQQGAMAAFPEVIIQANLQTSILWILNQRVQP